MIGFFLILSFIYIIFSTFSFNTLSFSHFFKSDVATNVSDEFHISYSLAKNNQIVFVEKDNDKYKVNKIKANNVDPVTITSIDASNISNYELIVKGDYAYLFYNNNENVKIIDYTYYKFNDLKDLPDGKTIVNEFNNSLYSYKNNTLTKLIIENDSYYLGDIYQIDNSISYIKSLIFANENEVIISTYTSCIYRYNLLTNESNLLCENYLNYEVYNDTLYYVYSYDNSHLGIGVVSNDTNKKFKIKACDYVSIKVVDDYLYLISENEINKVSISREKRHEKLQISIYQNSEFNLQNVLIVSEKLMYLPMIKYEANDVTNEYEYAYYLYRYKI